VISPNLGADLAEPVADLYRDAELRMLARIAWLLSQGLEADDWEVQQLGRLQLVRAEILAELALVDPAAAAAIQQQLDQAYAAGAASVLQDARGALDGVNTLGTARTAAVAALAADTAKGLTSAQPGILRMVDDVYRSVIADAAASVLTVTTTRRDAVQGALNRFLGHGLNAIQTKRGTMDLGTYATMAVRTAVARSAVQGHAETQQGYGLQLATIHPGPRACRICDKWARKVLSLDGRTGTVEVARVGAPGTITVHIDATLDEARAAGWGHPNCRCNLATFLPGFTKLDEIERPPWNEGEYQAQQQQRSNERQIRAWKTRQAIAITPEAQAEAREQVKRWQAQQRAHLAEHPYLKRQSSREQITGNLSGNPSGARPLRRV
jgi:hypothetical protein